MCTVNIYLSLIVFALNIYDIQCSKTHDKTNHSILAQETFRRRFEYKLNYD